MLVLSQLIERCMSDDEDEALCICLRRLRRAVASRRSSRMLSVGLSVMSRRMFERRSSVRRNVFVVVAFEWVEEEERREDLESLGSELRRLLLLLVQLRPMFMGKLANSLRLLTLLLVDA